MNRQNQMVPTSTSTVGEKMCRMERESELRICVRAREGFLCQGRATNIIWKLRDFVVAVPLLSNYRTNHSCTEDENDDMRTWKICR